VAGDLEEWARYESRRVTNEGVLIVVTALY
jgi:hypothetical protein